MNFVKPVASGSQGVLGQSVRRLEDPILITGRGRFAADISFPHQLHMRLVRSGYAHGRIVSINAEVALALPGVFAVWTHEDIADVSRIYPRGSRIEKLEPYCQPILAQGFVRYAGEPIVAVFAEDPYIAEDAAELIEVEIEELTPLIDVDGEPKEFSQGLSSEAYIVQQGFGDVDPVFRDAPVVVELTLSTGRHSGVPMETRGAIGRYDGSKDILELHGAAKVLHRNREHLARMLGRPLAGLHLHEGHTGGGFGVRGEIYPEDVMVLVAAMRLGRPVKWIEDRFEHLVATNHSREQRHRVRAACTPEGKLLAVDTDFFLNQGAYVRTIEKRVVELTTALLPGPYKIPAYRATGHFRMSNKTPAGTYRSPGIFEAAFVRERLMDAIAARLGLDRIEVRRRNLLTVADMPYETPLMVGEEHIRYDSGDYGGLFDKTLDRFGWRKLQEEVVRRKAEGEAVGLGLGAYVEKGGTGPRDGVRITVDADGAIEVLTGGASVGQGFETIIAQVCAEFLGADYRQCRVIHGQTDMIQYGIGAHASRATVMTGSATRVAALKVREKAIDMAAQLLQAPAEALEIRDGVVFRTDREGGPTVTLAKIAASLAPTSAVLGDRDPGLWAEGWFRTAHKVFPYGLHLAMVRVDRETGAVKVEKYLAAHDVGRAINPMLCEGQIVGGVVQGLGGALLEEFRYDERGQPLSTTFADYLMPTAAEVPDIDVLLAQDFPSPLNPIGLKGVGEAGVTAVGATIASAVDDAIGRPGAITQLPITPSRLAAILKS